jgi:pimeloyl-ACP methyl ester carboxylesterase
MTVPVRSAAGARDAAPTAVTYAGVATRRTGRGAPLVLLHALGADSRSWEPIVPALARNFTVITVDLPGFGASPPLASSEESSPAALADAIAGALDEAKIREPHVVGSSIGGWVALELAQIRPVATLTLLSPAGMWPDGSPWYCLVSLRVTRWLTQHLPRLLEQVARFRVGRLLLLGQTHGHPMRTSREYACAAIEAMGTCPGLVATLGTTRRRRYRASTEARDRMPPTTVAFGTRDLLLLRRSWRRTDQLPTHTNVRKLEGCGHVPMLDDPTAVVDLITATAGQRS